MKRILLTIITLVLLTHGGYSQSSGEKTAVNSGSMSPQTASAPASTLDEARRLSKEVVALYKDGKYNEALPLAKRTLELSEASTGPEDEVMVSALTNLGEIYIALGKHGDAIPMLTRILTIKEKQMPPDNQSIGALLSRLAYLFYMKGDSDKSAVFYQRAIEAKEKALGPDDLEVARLFLAQADVYRFSRKPRLAEQAYEQSINIYKKKVRWGDPAFQHAYERYSCLYAEQGQEDKVKELSERIKQGFEPSISKGIGGVLNGRAISLPKPEYPQEAKGAHLSSVIMIKVTIDEAGRVNEASDVCGGYRVLVKSALSAARQSRFTPTLLDGKAVKVTGVITYRFVGQ